MPIGGEVFFNLVGTTLLYEKWVVLEQQKYLFLLFGWVCGSQHQAGTNTSAHSFIEANGKDKHKVWYSYTAALICAVWSHSYVY
jgi:hypothetical protein